MLQYHSSEIIIELVYIMHSGNLDRKCMVLNEQSHYLTLTVAFYRSNWLLVHTHLIVGGHWCSWMKLGSRGQQRVALQVLVRPPASHLLIVMSERACAVSAIWREGNSAHEYFNHVLSNSKNGLIVN